MTATGAEVGLAPPGTSEATVEAYDRDDSPYTFGGLLAEWSETISGQ